MRGNDGFTLVEMLVVLGIAGILLALSTIQFSTLTGNKGIEKEARQLLADVTAARTLAMFSKKPAALVVLSAKSYAFKSYTSVNEATSAGSLGRTTTVPYSLTLVDGSSAVGTMVVFNNSGMACQADTTVGYSTPLPAPVTLRANPTNRAAVDSIMIDMARTSLQGWVNGSLCVK
jgi:type II secretion system protein H